MWPSPVTWPQFDRIAPVPSDKNLTGHSVTMLEPSFYFRGDIEVPGASEVTQVESQR